MKKAILFLPIVLMSLITIAQSPNKMTYQAVVRDTGSNLIVNQAVRLRVSIIQGSVGGTVKYSEMQTPSTNAHGLFSVEIGSGTIVSGNINNIDWSNGPYFIKTEIDPTGGTSYTISGTSQFLSVPYALHANIADSVSGSVNETDPIFDSSVAKGITSTDTAKWNDDLVNDADNDPLNELQQLSRNGDTLFLSESNYVILSSSSGNQTLSLNDDTLSISNGNYIIIPGFLYSKIGAMGIQGALDSGYSPCDVIAAGWDKELLYGATYKGGLIFYINTDSCETFVCASNDHAIDAEWGCYGTSISGADSRAIGSGKQNTIDILAGCTTTGIAADTCNKLVLNGYSDWYLPSIDELEQMYLNLKINGHGNFGNLWYWSSSEEQSVSANYALNIDFQTGALTWRLKTNNVRFRAIRSHK